MEIAGQKHAAGTVFNIQRFSIHDGPGIRTTAFLKGCPLHCRWCHNPEGIAEQPELLFAEDRCTGCGACLPTCPENAIVRRGEKIAILDRCTHCGQCTKACPEDALILCGRIMTADAVAVELERDRIFFEESGGGITLSGGEPLGQPVFALEILRRCRERGLHTVLDTSGYVDTALLLAAVPVTDLFLYDIKHPDTARHEAGTDVPNDLIMENLRTLCAEDCSIRVRYPVIPTFNDDPETVEQLGRLLERLGIRQLELLSYHALGRGKRNRMIRPPQAADFCPPHDDQMLAIRALLGKFSFEVLPGA